MEISENVVDFVGVYENALPAQTCETLIQTAELLFSREGVNRGINKLIANDLSSVVHTTMVNHKELVQKELAELDAKVNECTLLYLDNFPVFNNSLKSYHIKFQKTEPGQGYHIWHSENSSPTYRGRDLVWSVYLNDVTEGGETEFLYQHRRVPATQGTVLVFPAAFTHTHRGNPPISGVKYIATGWWSTYDE